MFEHYLKVALRNIWHHRITAAASVFALAIGFTCFIVALGESLLFTESDGHFAKNGRVQFVTTVATLANGNSITQATNVAAPWPLAPYITSQFPGLEVARLRRGGEVVASAEGQNIYFESTFADATFLRIFPLPFVSGDAVHALDRPRSVVLAQSTARRFFGNADPLGRSLTVRGIDLTVTGVTTSVPGPSHLARGLIKLDLLVSMDVFEEITLRETGRTDSLESRFSGGFYTYVVLPANGSITAETVNQRLAGIDQQFAPKAGMSQEFKLRPLSEMTLVFTDDMMRAAQTGLHGNVLALILGSLIIGLACLSYANLAAAQTAGRTKEVSLRRTVGARRGQLMVQHLVETAIKVVAAVAIGFLLAVLPLPVISNAVGFDVFSFFVTMPKFWTSLAIAVAAVTLVAGLYPALTLARISPLSALRTEALGAGRQRGRAILVGVQFVIVSVLLVLALVISVQNRALEQAKGSTLVDPIVVITNNMREAGVPPSTLRSEFMRSQHVKAATTMAAQPWAFNIQLLPLKRAPDAPSPTLFGNQIVGEGFFETFDIKLLAGRAFAADRGDSSSLNGGKTGVIVVNQALVIQMGWSSQEAVGKFLYRPAIANFSEATLEIIGVVENKSVKMLSPFAQSAIYSFEPTLATTPIIRLARPELAAGLADVDATWARLVPALPIRRTFADDIFRSTTVYFSALGAVILALAGFGALIAVMGLVGMAAYAMGRRRREVGIRRTLGSTIPQVLRLLMWGFSKPVVIATVLSWPIAYLAARGYLSLFATRAPLTPMPFLIVLVVVVGLTCAAVARQATSAARLNPADVLHYE